MQGLLPLQGLASSLVRLGALFQSFVVFWPHRQGNSVCLAFLEFHPECSRLVCVCVFLLRVGFCTD